MGRNMFETMQQKTNILRLLLAGVMVIASVGSSMASNYVRYVSAKNGAYSYDGTSWATAKKNVQDAINDLVDNLNLANGDHGYVFIEAGTYMPTESTETVGGSTLYMSFKIPAGISVYGGFNGTETADGLLHDSLLYTKRETITTKIGTFMKHQTILAGNLGAQATFTWNSSKSQYNASFFGNCYHVVWFATNGFSGNEVGDVRANGLGTYTGGRFEGKAKQALLDGCVIRDGYAFNKSITERSHNAFGGGIYMVDGAKVSNCEVFHCVASRSGGGVYMDGGGVLENCYVHDCQSLGVDTQTGFGGGVAIDQNGFVYHSAIVNNVGRLGGGISFYYDSDLDPTGANKYALVSAGTLVAQNTSAIEAGGVYMHAGGVMNGMTIVNNANVGSGVTINGLRTGRSGGVYVRDHARIYNSVFWGNETANSKHQQYASTRSSNNNDLKPILTYVSMSQMDYTDWSGSKKVNVSKLAVSNEDDGSAAASETYPYFKKPYPTCGHVEIAKAADLSSDTYLTNSDWQPTASSGLCYKGVPLIDIYESNISVSQAVLLQDIVGLDYSPRCALGAYVAEIETVVPTTYNGKTTIFVDPNRATGKVWTNPGSDWDHPLSNLTDALNYFRENNKSGVIYVKEGTVYPPSRHKTGRMRSTTVEMVSNVTVQGGYPTELTGRNLHEGNLKRNPILYPTIISGTVIDGQYANNVANLVTFNSVENAVLDGVQISWGNASSSILATELGLPLCGGGILINSSTNIKVLNTRISNCTGQKGAAVFAKGRTTAYFENCIMHNNTACAGYGEGRRLYSLKLDGGIIYQQDNASIELNHCDLLHNVGYALVNAGTADLTTRNSLYYANMNDAMEDTNGAEASALAALYGTGSIVGHSNIFDVKTGSSNKWSADLGAAVYDYVNSTTSSTYARFVNPTKNAGISEGGDQTYYGRSVDFTPSDMNPAVNAASTEGVAHASSTSDDSWGTDMSCMSNRDFGGLPDVGAIENGYFTASSATQPNFGTVIYVRDYNTYTYNEDGSVASVVTTDEEVLHADGTVRDGSSWKNALNGNAQYENNETATVTSFVQVSPSVNNLQYLYTIKLQTQNYYVGLNGQYLVPKDQNNAARFAFISADRQAQFNGDYYNVYYLYCSSNSQYVRRASGANVSTSGQNKLMAGGDKDIVPFILVGDASKCNIIPIDGNAELSWNWHGGVNNYGNTLGLYDSSDDNSYWALTGVNGASTASFTETITVSTTSIAGMQKAVNNAFATMQPYFVSRIEQKTEYQSSGSTVSELTYYDFAETDEHPEVSVWVGAGIYTYAAGYQIRNHVKVYGGFPREGNPSMNERHPQLTSGIPLSEANLSLNLKVEDYETVLQTNGSIAERDASTTSVSVLSHPQECRVTTADDNNQHRDRVVYEGAEWDGFTIRYGKKDGVTGGSGRRNGGAGVSMYENVVLRNCVVRDNYLGDVTKTGTRGRGAGVYCDGSSIVNCYLMDNYSACSGENFGGGLYMILGTMYNTVVAGNELASTGSNHGNGVFFESANFYNNTIVNNKGGDSAIGLYTASASEAHLTVYNSIVMADDYPVLWKASDATPANFTNCYLQSQNSSLYTSGISATLTDVISKPGTNPANVNPFALPYATATANYDYRIEQKNADYNCVNEGTEELGKDYDEITDVVLPDNDMDYTERIQDCTVDIGAYEYDGAYAISPKVEDGVASFYVTWFGAGFASAENVENAACAAKLQKVLDAAGRYKYQHPALQVVVRVAGYGEDAPTGKSKITKKNYYACRTTDYTESNEDVRIWSVMVPRGVQLWGGYDEAFTVRDVAFQSTYLAGTYINKEENSEATAYHVVEFVDEVYDADGKPYKQGDNLTQNSTYQTTDDKSTLMKMSDVVTDVNDRAVIDGLFIKGGQADGEMFSGSSVQNANQYGGVAIVNDFAHVRNCILLKNSGVYGGALAMTSKGLVSGSLIMNNTADYGGGIYIIEDGVDLSNGINNSTSQNGGATMDVNMPHVYTSTVVGNSASQQGGGLWFNSDGSEPNVRVNSCVFWHNDAPDQANVAGQTSPDMTDDQIGNVSTEDFYPISYTAVQNIRMSGTNNLSVETVNRNGTRFAIESFKEDIFDEKNIADTDEQLAFYGLTTYSALTRTGMPIEDYNRLLSLGLTSADFMGVARDALPESGGSRNYIDMGARALPSSIVATLNLMVTRLFVAQPEDVDMDAAEVLMNTEASTLSDENKRYLQMGSSFAYPFQNIDDALEYIYAARSIDPNSRMLNKANNLRFEICISRGNYYPRRDVSGNYGYSLANTYLIPEGVSLLGGFDCLDLYGQDSKPRTNSIYSNNPEENVEALEEDEVVFTDIFGNTTTILQQKINKMLDDRDVEDLNMNSIIEPWEFQNQTVLSGKTTNMENEGVYHVVMAIADQDIVGQLPLAVATNSSYDESGYKWKEQGQSITIDGLEISDGYAGRYVQGAYDSNAENGLYSYFNGGAILVDGNWYDNSLNGDSNAGYKHKNANNAVGYRDIPLYINRCKFNNNQAGYGGAIYTNGSAYVFASSFEQNRALSGQDRVKYNNKTSNVAYPGNGGAICYTWQLSLANTLFANNEAYDSQKRVAQAKFASLQDPEPTSSLYAGCGGAVWGGVVSNIRTANCDFVQNKASLYPAIFTLNPNKDYSANPNIYLNQYNQVFNTVFWRNETAGLDFGSRNFASNLVINYGPSNRSDSYNATVVPADSADLNTSNWGATVWFSAYEEGLSKAARNGQDFRRMPVNMTTYVPAQFKSYYNSIYANQGTYSEQNANVEISALNDELTGPNFRNPSTKSGYAGYSESADWSPARLNRLTDNGSGYLSQTVEPINGSYSCRFDKNTDGTYDGGGGYYTLHYATDVLKENMSVADEYYMESTADVELPRISYDPSPNSDIAYIDMGVYEYLHTILKPTVEGDEVDILWVSSEEKPENGLPDGSKWECPTSDLQRALETLMSSRNGHLKELRLADGEYTPAYTIHGYQSFYINTEYLNSSVLLPTDYYQNATRKGLDNYYVKSFVIKGGYSKDLNGVYDTKLYPAVMRGAKRTDATGTRWNHLLYIADATQRYGAGTDLNTGEGALANTDNQEIANPLQKSTTTIPIQIDGVTLINDQALPGTQGAAIRYDDQVYTTVYKDNEYTYEANAPIQCAVTNPDGTDFRYYTDDTYTVQTSEVTQYKQAYSKVNHPAKFIVSKCNIIGSGTHYDATTEKDYSSSAVYIGEHGGDALIYNTVFHSNYGSPLQAYNTRNFNNTFALNHGQMQLRNTGSANTDIPLWGEEGAGEGPMLAPRKAPAGVVIAENKAGIRPSAIHNTIMWLNNFSVAGTDTIYGKQFLMDGYEGDMAASSAGLFTNNAYTCVDASNNELLTEYMDYEEADGNLAQQHFNVYLSNNNYYVLNGPNFADPKLSATGSEIEERDFGVRPSFRILNKGNHNTYYYGPGGTEEGDRFGGVMDLSWSPNRDVDNRYRTRVVTPEIEIGAIEYQQPLMRIVYVDPNTGSSDYFGSDWENPLGVNDLQNAIDLASVFVVNSTTIETEPKEAYVFVKGGIDGKRFDESITLRNGVNVYGGVATGYSDYVPYRLNEYTNEYEYTRFEENIEKIISDRSAVAAPSAKRSIVAGIATNENDIFAVNGLPTTIDGFDVTPSLVDGVKGVISEPLISINPQIEPGKTGMPSLALRNCIVRDADASASSINLVNIDNALVYEMLIFNNDIKSGQSSIHLGDNAWGVNLTVEGVATDNAGTTSSSYNYDGGHYRASLINYAGQEKTWKSFTGYNYQVSDVKLDVRPLNYQLSERSVHIDECDPTSNTYSPSKYLPANLQQFIDYGSDVDLLGNRRLLNNVTGENKIDRGAFETWRVAANNTVHTAHTTGNMHFYPHEGSAVYLMEGSNLCLEVEDVATIPGFLLLKDGASLFGQGHAVKAAFVAVERSMASLGEIVALPYKMGYYYQPVTVDWQGSLSNTVIGPSTFSYDANGILTLEGDATCKSYSYNGLKRADTFYRLKDTNSGCWERMTEKANVSEGVNFVPGSEATAIYRFTAMGGNFTDYIYSETAGVESKAVAFTRNNHESESGDGELTSLENMSWNCFGIPYLVSNYQPYLGADGNAYSEGAYMMQTPRKMWLWYNGTQSPDGETVAVNGAGFYSVQSWSDDQADWHIATSETPRLWVGEGMFAQSATFDPAEQVDFYLPVFTGTVSPAPSVYGNNAPLYNSRTYVGDIEEMEHDGIDMNDTIYDMQGRRVQEPSGHGIYVVNGKKVWL